MIPTTIVLPVQGEGERGGGIFHKPRWFVTVEKLIFDVSPCGREPDITGRGTRFASSILGINIVRLISRWISKVVDQPEPVIIREDEGNEMALRYEIRIYDTDFLEHLKIWGKCYTVSLSVLQRLISMEIKIRLARMGYRTNIVLRKFELKKKMFSIRNFNYEKMEVIIFSSLENLNKPFWLWESLSWKNDGQKYFFSFQKSKINLWLWENETGSRKNYSFKIANFLFQ